MLPLVQLYKIQEAHEDMIQDLCGIFDTNCFELCPSGAGDTLSGIVGYISFRTDHIDSPNLKSSVLVFNFKVFSLLPR